jgi:hypothetical protein
MLKGQVFLLDGWLRESLHSLQLILVFTAFRLMVLVCSGSIHLYSLVLMNR